MAYIGKEPIVGNFQKCDAITVVNGQAAYTLQVSSTNVVPESANHMLVSLNGILQAPVTSFTVSGSTLTFASNLATGDVIDFVILLGNVLDLGVPSDDTVGAAQIKADLISGTTALASTPADTDEFLVSDAGTLKRIDYSLIKGGGAWEKLLTTTASGTSSIEFNNSYITTTYLDYLVVGTNIVPASDDVQLSMTISSDNGSSYASSNYRYSNRGKKDDGTLVNYDSTGGSDFRLFPQGTGSASGEGCSFNMFINDPLNVLSDNQHFNYHYTGLNIDLHTYTVPTYGAGQNSASASTAYNAIKFFFSSGNIETGKLTIYGRAV